MRAPADIASTSERESASDREHWGVSKDRGSFQLGAYRIEDVQRGEASQSGYSVFGFGNRKLSLEYRYRFVDGQSTRAGQCRQEQDRATTSYAGKVACQCAPAGGSLTVDIGRNAKAGSLDMGGKTYRVSPLRERESGRNSDEPLGYRIDGDAPLGAVELQGRTWTRRELSEPERGELTCMLAGLLLVRPLTYQRPTR